MNKLYKMDSKGKIREWSISVDKDSKGSYYEIEHGQQNGKMQKARTYVKSGKNVGKSNETSVVEQCLSEATSEWTKQRDRKGYSEDIPSTKPLKPMLAKSYKDEKDKVIYPCAVQPKLDGGRCLAHITKDGVKLVSRSLKEYQGLDHICQELAPLYSKYGNVVLDGELFSKSINFQEIMSLVRKTKNLSDQSSQIELWVYDMVSDKPFEERLKDWTEITEGLTYAKQVPTHIIQSEDEIVVYHKKFTDEGYEGAMIRNLNSPYKINSRSSDLLKYKSFIDSEFKIVGYEFGVGKFENVPTFHLVTKEGYHFKAVPTGTEEQRAFYLSNAKNYLGNWATVRFFEYTTTEYPVPRFPVIVDLDRTDYEV